MKNVLTRGKSLGLFAAALLTGAALYGLTRSDIVLAETVAQPRDSALSGMLSGAALVEALRHGGHVLYIRHASTEKDYADQVTAVMGDCSTQRTLSAAGWRESREIGAAIEALRIPVGAVYSSQYCRAWQTAEIAFERHVELAELNFEPAEDYTEAQVAAMRDRVKPLLETQPEPGYNLVYVAHDDPFEAATGIYPEPQGVAYVLKPGGSDGFSIVGAIRPDEWSALLNIGR